MQSPRSARAEPWSLGFKWVQLLFNGKTPWNPEDLMNILEKKFVGEKVYARSPGQFAEYSHYIYSLHYIICRSGASQTPSLQVPLTGGRWMTRWHRCISQPLTTGEPRCLNQRHVELGGGVVVLTMCWPYTLEVSTMNLSGGAGTRCSCSSFKRVLQCDAKLRNPMSLFHTFYKRLKYQHYRSDCTGLDSSCGFEWVVTEVENSPSSPQSVSWLQSDMPIGP